MSKLSDAIKAQQLDRRSPPMGRIAPITVVSEFIPSPSDFVVHRAYRLTVELGVHTSLPEGDGPALSMAIDRSRRLICEEVFGEFREHLYRLEVALMNHNEATATELLDELRRRMFDN